LNKKEKNSDQLKLKDQPLARTAYKNRHLIHNFPPTKITQQLEIQVFEDAINKIRGLTFFGDFTKTKNVNNLAKAIKT